MCIKQTNKNTQGIDDYHDLYFSKQDRWNYNQQLSIIGSLAMNDSIVLPPIYESLSLNELNH